jgi:TM2 domain-containing membrane protein YozV
MKVAYKAALLSAFIFPGVGHFYLKKYWRGLAIMFIALSGLGFMIWSVTASAFKNLDSVMVKMQGGATSLQEISDIVGLTTVTTAPYFDAVFYVIACLWIFALIDAYRIGKQGEFQDEEPSEW